MSDISTSGWDVVSITDLETINSIINTGEHYPLEFSEKDKLLGVDIIINGKWGSWKVSSNASGGRINILCEIDEGVVNYFESDVEINNDIDKSYIEIELSLKGISTNPNEWVQNEDVIIDTTRCYKLMINSDDTIIVTNTKFTNPNIMEDGLNLILPLLFAKWFKSNLNTFTQIFSVILIGLKTQDSDFQWLYPSAYSYAANSSLNGETTGFGVLTLIDGKTETGQLQQSVDIAALRLVKEFGGNLALVVSKTMFVKHILLKAAVSLIKSSKESDFTISDSGLSLTNNRDLLWQDFESDDGKYISPIIPKESFILNLQSDFIHITIIGAHYRPQMGVTVFMGVEQAFRYKVEKNAKGEPVFVPDESGLGDAVVSCSVKLDDWLNALKITMGIITSIASVFALGTTVAGALAARANGTIILAEAESMTMFEMGVNGAEAVITPMEGVAIAQRIASGIISNPTMFNAIKIGSIVTAATSGIVWSAITISEAVYNNKFDDVPSFHHFANKITGTSIWPNMSDIELKSASLADSFVIGLELKQG